MYKQVGPWYEVYKLMEYMIWLETTHRWLSFLHLGTTESRKNLEQKFIFQIVSHNPHGIKERFSFN